MSKQDVDLAIAILQANVKRAKKKNVTTVQMADACETLMDELKDHVKVGKLVNLSREMIREFLLIASLDKDVKKLIEKNDIKIDAARRIAKIKGKTKQKQTVQALSGLPSQDARALMDYILKNNTSPEKSKKIILGSKTKKEETNIIAITLNKEEFSILNKEAKKHHFPPRKFAEILLKKSLNMKVGKKSD